MKITNLNENISKNSRDNVVLRRAAEKDLLGIAKVHHLSAYKAYENLMDKDMLKEIFSVNTILKDWKDYLEKAENNSNLIPYVAVQDGEVIGVLRASKADNDDASLLKSFNHSYHEDPSSVLHIKNIYISPSAQRMSLGQRMINKVALLGKDIGCDKAITTTLKGYENSPQFFKKVGDASLIGCIEIDSSISYKSLKKGCMVNLNIWDIPSLDMIITRTSDKKPDAINMISKIIASHKVKELC